MQRFFAPGRTELAGNHTDHQLGRVLAASVDVGITARATRRRDMACRRACPAYHRAPNSSSTSR